MTKDWRTRYGPWAVVTGASSGIGEAFAHQLAAAKLNLVLVARRAERLEATARRLREAHGIEVHAHIADLQSAADRDALWARCSGLEVGLFVNNAGFGSHTRFLAGERQNDLNMVRLNCEAVLDLTHRFIPPMVERGRGGMIILSSVVGHQPIPYMTVYSATKAFDLYLAEGLWAELRGTGVDVLALCPGHTETEFHEVANLRRSFTGASATPEQVVRRALRQLGRRPTTIHGLSNRLLVWATRFFPAGLAARVSAALSAPRE